MRALDSAADGGAGGCAASRWGRIAAVVAEGLAEHGQVGLVAGQAVGALVGMTATVVASGALADALPGAAAGAFLVFAATGGEGYEFHGAGLLTGPA